MVAPGPSLAGHISTKGDIWTLLGVSCGPQTAPEQLSKVPLLLGTMPWEDESMFGGGGSEISAKEVMGVHNLVAEMFREHKCFCLEQVAARAASTSRRSHQRGASAPPSLAQGAMGIKVQTQAQLLLEYWGSFCVLCACWPALRLTRHDQMYRIRAGRFSGFCLDSFV